MADFGADISAGGFGEQESSDTSNFGGLGDWDYGPRERRALGYPEFDYSAMVGGWPAVEAKNFLNKVLRGRVKPTTGEKLAGYTVGGLIQMGLNRLTAGVPLGGILTSLADKKASNRMGIPTSIPGKLTGKMSEVREAKGLMSRAGFSQEDIDKVYAFVDPLDPGTPGGGLMNPNSLNAQAPAYGRWADLYRNWMNRV
jgi:hypothetical protein